VVACGCLVGCWGGRLRSRAARRRVRLVADRRCGEVVGAAHVDDAAVDDLQCAVLEGGGVHTTGGQKVAGGLEQPEFDVLYVTQQSALVELDLAPVLGLILANTDPAAAPAR